MPSEEELAEARKPVKRGLFPNSGELAKKLDEKQRAAFEEWEKVIAKALNDGVDVVDAGRAIKVDIPLTISYKYLNEMQKKLVISGYNVHAWDEFGNAIRFHKKVAEEDDDETAHPPFENIWEEARRSWDEVLAKAQRLFSGSDEPASKTEIRARQQQQPPRAGKMHISIPLREKAEIRGERDDDADAEAARAPPRHLLTVLFWMVVKFFDTAPVWKVFFGPLIVSAIIAPVWLHRVVLMVVGLVTMFRLWRWALTRNESPVARPAQQKPKLPVYGIHNPDSHRVTIKQDGDYMEIHSDHPDDIRTLKAAADIFARSERLLRDRLARLGQPSASDEYVGCARGVVFENPK